MILILKHPFTVLDHATHFNLFEFLNDVFSFFSRKILN
jgi:hypothetical protein